MKSIYDVLRDKTPIAIARAKRQYEAYGILHHLKDARRQEFIALVEELQNYI